MTGLLERLPKGPFTIGEAAARGVSHTSIYRWVREGSIQKIAAGLYLAHEQEPTDLDLLEAARRAPLATICLSSVLAQEGLIDEIPSVIDLAIPRGANPPRTQGPIEWHVFAEETFYLGRSTAVIDDLTGFSIGRYSAERSIVDAFRLRDQVGYETSIEALKSWLARPKNQPASLIALAQQIPRARGPLLKALEILL